MIPDKAIKEYRFSIGENLMMISGSKTSGGFGLTSMRLLTNTSIGNIIFDHLKKKNVSMQNEEIINIGNKLIGFVEYAENGSLALNEIIINKFSLRNNSKLLVVRGSGLALTFITKGPIFLEALNHNYLRIF